MPSLSLYKEQGLISEEEFQQLCRFADLILEWNPRINLTGFKSRERVEEMLLGESILAGRAMPRRFGAVLDFGSGAGIPGLVWAITERSLQVTSLEIRQKKVAFQKEVVRSLGVKVEILLGRFPEAVLGRRFDIITSRAIRFSPALWTAGRRLLKPGGSLVRFAASNTREEGWKSIPISARTALLILS